MKLDFKEIRPEDAPVMMPYYSMRKNRTCDSVFLESFLWKEFYRVRYAIWEDKALLWLMEDKGRCFSAMPLCREEDLPAAFGAIEAYFNEELGYPLVINLADEYAVQYLNLPPEKYRVLSLQRRGPAQALRQKAAQEEKPVERVPAGVRGALRVPAPVLLRPGRGVEVSGSLAAAEGRGCGGASGL